jgi:hypothetical protein
MTDFNYKKYSLENLEKWVEDAISTDDVTPQEIYDVVVKVARENHEYHSVQLSRMDELLGLLNGNGGWTYDEVMREREYYEPESKGAWNDFWKSSHQEYLKTQEDKVVKWQLPVQVDGLTGDCYIELPDDLLEAAGLKEGDTVEWIDLKNGSFEMRKVNGTK